MTTAPQALVLGGGLTALGTMRALARAGISSHCTAGPDDCCRRSRWFQPAAVPLAAATLAADLDASPYRRVVLIPCADDLALAVARLPDALHDRFPRATAPAAVLERLADKSALATLLAEAGLPHPGTWPVDGPAGLDAVPADAWPQAFLKPCDSQAFFAAHGRKAIRVTSRADAEDRLRVLRAAGFAMQVQEYVDGPVSHTVFVDGFVDRRGAIAGLLVRRRLRISPPDFGNSSYMVSIAPSAVPDAVASVRRLVDVAGYRGPFSVELKRGRADGMHRIIEINVRPWWFVEFAAECGVNVPALMVADALGRDLPPAGPYAVGRTLVHTSYDLFACLALWRRGELSLGRWIRSWLGAARPVLVWRDPAPGLCQTVQWIGDIVRRRLARRRAGARS